MDSDPPSDHPGPPPRSAPRARTGAVLLWVALGLLISFPGLRTRTPFYDEVFEIRMASRPVVDQLRLYAHPEDLGAVVSPPLFHVLLHPVVRWLGSGEWAVRSISWIAGGLSVGVLFALLQGIFPRRLAILATLGFAISDWHLQLAQTARQHSLFVLLFLLALWCFREGEEGRRHHAWYALALIACIQTYYWGILAVVPAHVLMTWFLRHELKAWRRGLIVQFAAGLTFVPHVPAILHGFRRFSDDAQGRGLLGAPLFGRSFVNFAASTLGHLDLWALPAVLVLTAAVVVVMALGVRFWYRGTTGVSRWIGGTLLLCIVLLFGLFVSAKDLVTLPMFRKYAILQIAFLYFFLSGLCSIRTSWRHRFVLFAWLATCAWFGIYFLTSDLHAGSRGVARELARLSPPLLVFSDYGDSLRYLMRTEGASLDGLTFRDADLASPPEPEPEADATICYSFFREGGYLRAQVNALLASGESDPDRGIREGMEELSVRLQRKGWEPLAALMHPDRISYAMACFQPAGQ